MRACPIILTRTRRYELKKRFKEFSSLEKQLQPLLTTEQKAAGALPSIPSSGKLWRTGAVKDNRAKTFEAFLNAGFRLCAPDSGSGESVHSIFAVLSEFLGAWPYNRPCAQQYVAKSQSCMVGYNDVRCHPSRDLDHSRMLSTCAPNFPPQRVSDIRRRSMPFCPRQMMLGICIQLWSEVTIQSL